MNLREVETLQLILDQQRKIIVNKYFIYNINLISGQRPKSANIIIYMDTKFAQRYIRLGRQVKVLVWRDCWNQQDSNLLPFCHKVIIIITTTTSY